jgi:hypothetical protein
MLTKITTEDLFEEYELPDCPKQIILDCKICQFNNICNKEWYPADEVDKLLAEKDKGIINLTFEVDAIKKLIRERDKIIEQLKFDIEKATYIDNKEKDKQFELLKEKIDCMSCDGAISPAYGDLLVGQKKGELIMLNKCKKLIEKAQQGELK